MAEADGRDGEPDLPELEEPAWWVGRRPLPDVLGEMLAVIREGAARRLQRWEPDPAPAPVEEPGIGPAAAERAGAAGGEGASEPEGGAAGTDHAERGQEAEDRAAVLPALRTEARDPAPRARPLALPGLEGLVAHLERAGRGKRGRR